MDLVGGLVLAFFFFPLSKIYPAAKDCEDEADKR